MKVKKIEYSIVEIPLKQNLKHARKKFSTTENLIIKLHVDNEIIGVGECCPRKYVGRNSVYETSKAIEKLRKKLLGTYSNIEEFLNYCDKLGIDNHLKAALDIAFTDAYCKSNGIYLYEYIDNKKREYIRYDGGAPLTTLEETLSYINKFYNHGVRRFKLKADKDIDSLVEKVKTIRENFDDIKIKIDANSSWDVNIFEKVLRHLERYEISLIEDPIDIEVYNLNELRKIKRETSIPLMVDEGLITQKDAKKFIEYEIFEWFNIKISKNGGIHSSLEIAKMAEENDIFLQLGSHYGECGILESVRRQTGCSSLFFDSFEGANRILLSDDIVVEDLSLKEDLKADLSYISDYGLGIHLKRKIRWK